MYTISTVYVQSFTEQILNKYWTYTGQILDMSVCRRLLLQQFDKTAQDGFGDMNLNGAVVGIGERQCLLDGADAEDEPQVDDVFSAKADKLLLDMGYVRESLLYLAQSVGHHEVYGAGIEDVGIVVIGLHVDDLVQVDDVELVMSTET